ncbi:hypothetical protein [Alicyclobacillus ferrooxydans]|uniref:Uncharacterized protein n=1 Tax=Alicyclobacillus ferrooxydans TaxID=471514 RepID=A0A0P9CZV2_9BACL|nr:hypothetical protein [Alicyclobacillus ferrooxydans]KPV42681.1 hypothetical protein AN477_16240 [Alicyclobacillus ferrooxydans]
MARNMKHNGQLTKEELRAVASSGNFIYDPDYQRFADLDGTEAKRYLESKGFHVIRSYDTGRNGQAITECGLCLSTNGYLHQMTLE